MTPAEVSAPESVASIPVLIAQLQHEDHIFFEMVCSGAMARRCRWN